MGNCRAGEERKIINKNIRSYERIFLFTKRKYQGRVYSISGNDSRYPALYKTAFKSGYSIIHPNCRHSWSPYHVELYSEEEKRQALERSNRSWRPDGDGRRFQQTETLRTQYAVGQQKLRQWNAEILEYERMKDHYKKIGQPPPYSTLGAFRREARKPREQQSVALQEMRSRIAEENRAQRKVTVEKGIEIIIKRESWEEEKELNDYQIPQEPIARLEKDAEKWEKYDADYDRYKSEEPNITKDVDKISQESGLPLIGREYRLKSKKSYDRKVNDKRLQNDYKPLGDVVRYTFEHKLENAPEDINKTLAKFREMGYNIVAVDNKWRDAGAYNGINVDIVSPNGVHMEVQFMTRNNHAVKEMMHHYYEIARDSRTPEHIRKAANKKMQKLSKLWERPERIEEV